MIIEKIITIKFTQEDLEKHLIDKYIEMTDEEDIVLEASYASLGEYKFKIVRKESADEEV